MKMKYAFALLLLTTACSLTAQIRYGFKTGLNFARFDGPSETNDAGESLESFGNVTGFHIGATFAYNFTDNFSLRGEVMYSKRGSKYTFDGQSYRIFQFSGGSTLTTGESRYLVNVNNSYIDIPVMGVARWGDFEISGGGYVGFLVGATGDGSLRYAGKSAPPLLYPVKNAETGSEELVFNLNHNYRKDDVGEGDDAQKLLAEIGPRTIEMPKTLGAYFDHTEDKGSLYNTLDFGLVGGISYYLSSSLYAGVRLQYGLADLTNNDADLSKARTAEDGSLIFRDDKDKNFAIQVSVGFSF